MLGLELLDLLADGRRQLGPGGQQRGGLQSGFAGQAIRSQPMIQTALADAQFPADRGEAETLLLVEPDGAELFGHGVAPSILRRARPPRGAGGLLLCYWFFIHVNTSFIIEVSTTLPLKSVSRTGR